MANLSNIPDTLRELVVPIDQLRPYRKNPREGDVTLIADSLRRHGQYRPVVANRRSGGEVLAGNHTLKAALSLGWTELAVSWVDVDDERAARIVLIDNRASDVAGYDESLLAEVLSELPDLDGTGWSDKDLAALLAGEEPVRLTDPDDAPAASADGPWLCQPGQVWSLGPHRLAVGDCTDQTLIDALLEGAAVDLLLTDPPYGVSYQGRDGMKVLNDELRDGELRALLLDAFRQARRTLRPGAPFYVFGPSNEQQTAFRLALADAGLRLRSELVWVKNSLVLGHSDYQPRHESVLEGSALDPAEPNHQPAFYGWQEGAAHPWFGGRKQSTVWEYPKPRRSDVHPTMKPVEMLEQAIRNSTETAAVVLDLFAGSGSTLIACHGTRRIARVCELFPKYADVICRRYQEHTGTLPVLAASGEAVDFTLVPAAA